MTRRQVWQYRCEFCGKRNLSAASISKHEKHCTKNPARVCRMCAASGGEQKPLVELVGCIDLSLPDEGYRRLRELAGECPACILTALVNSDAHRPGYTLMNHHNMALADLPTSPFDFKAECKAWWEEFNSAFAERTGWY